ncbi:MAG TPA: 3-methyladenine DNA glycosylase [Kiritimatiellia bacterium]|nr:3-methyladenine DNA glycosylase [Kiritimatiellia bacterium]
MPVSDSINRVVEIALEEWQWRERIDRHHQKLNPIINEHLDRASRHIAHPVMDFLFTYYPFSVAQLMRWTPGLGVKLSGNAAEFMAGIKGGRTLDDGWELDITTFPSRRCDAVRWVVELLEKTAERPPRFGCYGLHEWAMVYRCGAARHDRVPLRFPADQLAGIVESLPIACSHYDAFRFFTPEARPLNRLQPTLKTRTDMEQRGCLHVNMDLYKWAQQFYPWISSDLIADCFLLAVQIREVDMRASPYDLQAWQLEPIRIETESGRREYVDYQQAFATAAEPLRGRLVDEFRCLARAITSQTPTATDM